MNATGNDGVWLITGAQAVGKSTVAQLLAERFARSVHLRGDRFRRMIVGGRAAPNTPEWDEELRVRYSTAGRVADAYAEKGFTVVWQDCLIGPMLGDVPSWVHARPLRIVVLTAQPDVLEYRDAHRHKRGYGDDWSVEQLHNIVERNTPRIGTWIDNSDLTPGETVAAIMRSTATQVGTETSA